MVALALVCPLRAAPANAQSSARADGVAADQLKAAVHDDAVRAFYASEGWHGAWSATNAKRLDDVLAKRKVHGLDRVDFLPGNSSSGSAADVDVARTRAALAYAAALAHGRADPGSVHDVYTLPRPDPDLTGGLAKALGDGTLDDWLNGLAPQDEAYRQLSDAYLHEREQAQGASPDKIAADGTIHVGDSDPRVAAIEQQLTDDGYLSAAPEQASAYTQPVADAVEQLQRDYGIVADGVVGPDTLKVLNLGPGDRARALAVGLERRRWLSRTPPATRIDVNTAAAELRYYRDGKLVDRRKVIVGQPGKETPLLSAPIYRLVANPTWTIPKSIQTGEMSGVGSSYLRAHNMVRRHGWIVQKSGPDNALGVVKFDMKDDQAIYLHDTSSRSLFDRSQRHLSHGCVRVEDAPGFAKLLAGDEGIADRWEKAAATKKQTFIALPTEIPVRLLYQNAFVDQNQKVAIRTDPYGWNDAIAEKLGYVKASASKAKTGDVDIGP